MAKSFDKSAVCFGFGMMLSLSPLGGSALAAHIINNESVEQTIVVTEGASKRELVITAGEQAEFCPSGCFVTLPNGDREALTGSETITLKEGRATLK